MKIAMLSSFYAPHKGGTEKYVEDLSASLVKRGHEVTVFTHTPGKTETVDGVRVERVPALWMGYMAIPTDWVSDVLDKFDVVNSHIPPSTFALDIALPPSVPHVVTYHCDPLIPERYKGRRVPQPVRRALSSHLCRQARKALNRADSIIVTSSDYAESSEILSGYYPESIPIGVEKSSYSLDCSQLTEESGGLPSFIYIGRLASGKGIDVLLRAAGLMYREGRRFKIEIVGGGEEEAALKTMAAGMGLDDVVVFRGRLEHEQLLEALGRSRALVLPSISRLEAFGIVQLEAFCMKKPVVVSALPGVRQIVRDSAGGWLFQPGDHRGLAERLGWLIENEQEAVDAGQRGYRSLDRLYNWTLISERMEAVYHNCLSARKSA